MRCGVLASRDLSEECFEPDVSLADGVKDVNNPQDSSASFTRRTVRNRGLESGVQNLV